MFVSESEAFFSTVLLLTREMLKGRDNIPQGGRFGVELNKNHHIMNVLLWARHGGRSWVGETSESSWSLPTEVHSWGAGLGDGIIIKHSVGAVIKGNMRGCRKLCKLDLCGLKERATELIFKGLLETDYMLCARSSLHTNGIFSQCHISQWPLGHSMVVSLVMLIQEWSSGSTPGITAFSANGSIL